MEKSKTYVIYAIGEIALVVIGILIALQVNNWNEERLDRSKELQIVSALYQELQTNLSYHQDFFIPSMAIRTERSGKELLNFCRRESYEMTLDSFYFHIEALQSHAFYAPITARFEQVINGEEIALITNDSLNNLLITYDVHNELSRRVTNQSHQNAKDFERYVDEHLNTSSTLMITPNPYLSRLKDLGYINPNETIERIRENKTFENLIIRRIRENSFVIERLNDTQDHIRVLLKFAKTQYNL